MKQRDLEQLVIEYKQEKTDEKLNDILVTIEPLLKYWCQTQCYLSWEKEDLLQVARIAVVGALERFDPDKGIRFKTFAYRTVSGKIMNYFRDSTWRVNIPRKYRELSTYISKAEGEYYKKHGQNPTTEEIAKTLGVSVEEIEQAMEAKRATQTTSLSEQFDNDESSTELMNFMGEEDKELGQVETRQDLGEALEELDERQRKVVYYRFYEDMTQSKIAELMGISQMQVSRLEKAALAKIKSKLIE